MTKEVDLEAIRERLEARRAVLLSRLQVKQTQAAYKEVENADRSDLAQEYFDRDRNTALMAQMEETLEDIEAALFRLDEDTYGRCISCGGKISTSRLEALPHARLCIQCKKVVEEQEYKSS
jgi:DnaK suppressor protein